MKPDKVMLKVSELFYSPQGEGARSGEMSRFVRLQGCSAKFACAALGVVCDTEFESGKEMTLTELAAAVAALGPDGSDGSKWIVWTGGEPLDQLTPDIVGWFKELGYRQALETSGVKPLEWEFRVLFDWITCSPKVAEHILAKHFGEVGLHHYVEGHTIGLSLHVHELRYVRHKGQELPQPSLKALTYYLSPHSDGFNLNAENVRHVLDLCRKDPRWRISVQYHKVLGVL